LQNDCPLLVTNPLLAEAHNDENDSHFRKLDMISRIDAAHSAPPAQAQTTSDAKLREAAEKLETQFLSEMLKAAGFGEPRSAFGGGAGEAQFASFLREAQAEEMVKARGIGLADRLFESLKERTDDAS